MSGAVLAHQPRELAAGVVRRLLARARWERMRAQLAPAVVIASWDERTPAAQEVLAEQEQWLVPALLTLVTAPFVVGAADTLDGRLGNFCLAGLGSIECTRAPHADELHAAGDGHLIVAVWVGRP